MPAVRPIALAGVLAVTAVVSLTAQQAVYRKGTVVVPVYVTATDTEGRLVTNLTRDDFVIFDNGVPQPTVVFNAGPIPISIVVMLDMSGSMANNISRVRGAAVQLFTRLRPADRARVGAIADKITISPTFTNNVDELIRTTWVDLTPGDSTPLWAGTDEAMSALSTSTGRRVVLLLSDGWDSGSAGLQNRTATLLSVTRRVHVEDVMIYAVGMSSTVTVTGGFRSGSMLRSARQDRTLVIAPHGSLRPLALASGGWYFELNPDDELGPTFAQVANELHAQYELGFKPAWLDGKEHQLEVRMLRPGVSARARKTYVAVAER